MSNDPKRPTRRPVRGPQGETANSTADDTNVEAVVESAPESAFETVEVTNHYEPEPTVAPAVEREPIVEPEPVVAPLPVEAEPVVAPLPVEPEPTVAPQALAEEPLDEMPPLVAETATGKKFGRGAKVAKPAAETTKKKRSYNPKKKSLIITGSVVGGIVLVLGFSLYKVGSAPSTEDIVTVYQEQSGDLGFPVDKGQDAATRFLSLYLDIPEDSTLRQQHKEMLDNMLIGAVAPSAPQGVSQRVISGPVPAGLMLQTSAGTASQRYTAIVETTVTEQAANTSITGDPIPAKVTKKIETVTYRVNLEVDPTGAAVLVRGNPTLIPNSELTPEMKMVTPPPAPDGGFSNDIAESLVKPFFKVWAESDAAAINNWLATGADGLWTKGLQNTQTMGNVTVSAPLGVKGNSQGDVLAEVEWISPEGTRQTSTYTLSIVFENSRWLISNLT